jgi:hypothetical protein
MTDDRFDSLTKLVSKSTSRRGLFKGAAALALSGVAARLRGVGEEADARSRVSMACARLGQDCATGRGTPGNLTCCPGTICGDDLTCCMDTDETCRDDGDCCGDNVCRPNPRGIGGRCLPPGDVGAKCIDQADCAGDLVCDPAAGLCLVATGGLCAADADCVSGICDDYTGLCVGTCLAQFSPCASPVDCCVGLTCSNNQCLALDGEPCLDDAECASGLCDEYTGICVGACLELHSNCVETTDCCLGLVCTGGVCLGGLNALCDSNDDCVSNFCDLYTSTCQNCVADGATCADDGECCSGICDAYTATCIATLLPDGAPCLDDEDCDSGFCDEYTGICVATCLGDSVHCTESSDCCSTYCEPYTGTCTNFCKPDLVPCTFNEECCVNNCGPTGLCYPKPEI